MKLDEIERVIECYRRCAAIKSDLEFQTYPSKTAIFSLVH